MSGKSPEIVGQYLVFELLGRGGMATVHRAETQGLEGFRRPVALKRLHGHLAADEELVRSFIHEARLASKLRHTNCAQTYDLGRVDGTYFIAMEYVPGATVSQIIRQCNAAAGLIPIPIAVSILLQVLDGLDHAHNLVDDSGKPLGIIHRDVSPSNIIVSSTGVVKLIDFGIAKADSVGVRTQTGLIKGKFGYVAPEYTHGQLDSRCDLWAVGVIAHELLTGMRLFEEKDNFSTILALREAPIQPPSRWRPDVPRDLDDIVLTALQRDPSMRWQSASAMRIALGNLARDAKLEVTNQTTSEWIEWAFTQQPRGDDTKLNRAIATLGEPSTGSAVISIEQRDELDEAAETMIRPSAAPEGVEVVKREYFKHFPTKKMRPLGPTLWILYIVLVLGTVTAFALIDHYGYEIDLSVVG